MAAYQYNLGKRLAGQAVVTFDPDSRRLLCKSDGRPVAVAIAMQGNHREGVMSELAGIFRLPTRRHLTLPLFPDMYR